MAKSRNKFAADNPKSKYWRSMPLTTKDQHPFIELNEVDWHNLEEWHQHSRPRQAIRIPSAQRNSPISEPLSFMKSARHHTTRGRSKSERMMDQYWFVPEENRVSYRELAYSNAIPRRRTTIYPPFLPKGRPTKKASGRFCKQCGGPFEAKRADALFCSPACRKASSRCQDPK